MQRPHTIEGGPLCYQARPEGEEEDALSPFVLEVETALPLRNENPGA